MLAEATAAMAISKVRMQASIGRRHDG
jgi:hypothetical protein